MKLIKRALIHRLKIIAYIMLTHVSKMISFPVLRRSESLSTFRKLLSGFVDFNLFISVWSASRRGRKTGHPHDVVLYVAILHVIEKHLLSGTK